MPDAQTVQIQAAPVSVAQFVCSWANPADFGYFSFIQDQGGYATFAGIAAAPIPTDGRVFQIPITNLTDGWALPIINQVSPIVVCFSQGADPRLNKNDFMLWLWPDSTFAFNPGSTRNTTLQLGGTYTFKPPVPFYFKLQRDWNFFRVYTYYPGTPPFQFYEADGNAGTGVTPNKATLLLTFHGT